MPPRRRRERSAKRLNSPDGPGDRRGPPCPYEVLTRLPGADVRLVAETPGEKATDGGPLKLMADHALAEVPGPEIVVESVLGWLRSAHERSRWTTSVCWGSAGLGAAGLLERREATSHWLARDGLAQYGARPVDERVVISGKVVTSAGVSAGIDMAALEAGTAVAQQMRLLIEYNPQPPFDAGSPDRAPVEVVEALRGRRA